MNKLTFPQINEVIKSLPGWTYNGEAIQKDLSFSSYMAGIEFVNELALKAEEANHHPDLTVGWCAVTVQFSTHDAGGVTEKDIAMAKEVELILASK